MQSQTEVAQAPEQGEQGFNVPKRKLGRQQEFTQHRHKQRCYQGQQQHRRKGRHKQELKHQELRYRCEQENQPKQAHGQPQAGAQNHPSAQTGASTSLSCTNLGTGAGRSRSKTDELTGQAGGQSSPAETYQTAQGQQQKQASQARKYNTRSTHNTHKTLRQHRPTSEGKSGDQVHRATVEKGNGAKWPSRPALVAQEESRHQIRAPAPKQAQAKGRARKIKAIQPGQAGWILRSRRRRREKVSLVDAASSVDGSCKSRLPGAATQETRTHEQRQPHRATGKNKYENLY